MSEPEPSHHSVADARRIAKGTSIGAVGGIATALFMLGYAAAAGRSLGEQRFGLLALATVVYTVVAETADLGLDFGVIRYGAAVYQEGRMPELRGLVRAGLVRVWVAGIAFAVILEALAGVIVGTLLGHPDAVEPVRIMAVAIPFAASTDVITGGLKARQTVRESTFVLQIFNPGGRLVTAIAIGVAGGGLIAFSVAFMAVEIATTFCAVVLAWRPVLTGRVRVRRSDVLGMASYSWPLSLNRALLYTNNQTEIILLGVFGTAALIGIFQAALQVALLTAAILAAVSAIFSPVVAAALSTHNRGRVQSMYATTTKWSLMIGLPYFLFVVTHSHQIMGLFGTGFTAGAEALAILALGRLVDLATGSVAAVLVMAGYSRLSLINSLIFLGTSVVGDIILIPRYHLVGAAIASAIAVVLVNVLRVGQVWHLLRVQPFQWRLIGVVAAGLIALPVTLLLPDISGRPAIQMLIELALAAVIYLPALWLLAVDDTDRQVLAGVRRGRRAEPQEEPLGSSAQRT